MPAPPRRHRTLLLAVMLVGALVVPASPASSLVDGWSVTALDPSDTTGLSASPNVEFVTNVPFEVKYPRSSRLSVDMDFWTKTVNERPGEGRGRGGPQHQVTRDFAFVGTYMNGLQVVDITDPRSPDVVATYDCVIAQADVFLFERADLGRTFVAYTSDAIASQTRYDSDCHTDNGVAEGSYGTFIVDVTDPYNPTSVSFVEFPRGTHQVTIDPSGHYIYSSPAAVVTDTLGEVHIADISDPENPGQPQTLELLTGLDAHDIIFSDDGTRAYVAALTHSLVLDTTDPGDPQIIGRILDPSINIHHEAHPYTTEDPLTGQEHTFLLIVDEFAGAVGNEICPGGGVHVYDITGDREKTPLKVGAFFAPQTGLAEGAGQGFAGTVRCTAHVMQVHPDEGIATIAWYGLGTRVLDLTGLVGISAGVDETVGSLGLGIREVAYAHFDDGDVWATKTNRIEDGAFYVYAADTARMLDIFHVDLTAPTSDDPGSWLTAEATAARALTSPRPNDDGTLQLSCFIR